MFQSLSKYMVMMKITVALPRDKQNLNNKFTVGNILDINHMPRKLEQKPLIYLKTKLDLLSLFLLKAGCIVAFQCRL